MKASLSKGELHSSFIVCFIENSNRGKLNVLKVTVKLEAGVVWVTALVTLWMCAKRQCLTKVISYEWREK